ncbi:AraC family ligand binding domain-containing protein [Paenibacillus sp. CC-CFT747]|nr:AraC family ligand binding domain-containing protein [Paenibacillus sp. CC-CFT747]
MTTAGQWIHQEPVNRPEAFPPYQWLLVLSGEGVLHVDGRELRAGTGQAICLFPGVPHRYSPIRKPWGVMFLSMEGSQCALLLERAGIQKSGVFQIADMVRMTEEMSRIRTAAHSEETYFVLTTAIKPDIK